MKKLVLILLLALVPAYSCALSNRTMRGIAEISAGLATIGLAIYNIKGCQKKFDTVAEHPVKTVLFNHENISNLVKDFGVRTGISAGAIFAIGLPLCYLGMFELLHKPEPNQ